MRPPRTLRRRAAARALVLVAVLAALTADAAAATAAPDRLIVSFRPDATAADRAAAHGRADARALDRIAAIHADVVSAPDAAGALRRYRSNPAVRAAERDTVARALHDDCATASTLACVLPSDPRLALQWGLQNDASTVQPAGTAAVHDADVDAPYAWSLTRGAATTRIAILDSGIDLNHEDLAAKVVASRNVTRSRTLDDKYGHGTAVAGVAAAITDNGVGIAGMAFDASLMNVKVLDDRGIGGCSTVAKGITWATDNGAHVVNMSLGFGDCTAGRDAVAYAWRNGVLMTAAAGNDGDSSATFPAYYPEVIAVAATDNADAKTSFSQHGTWVDVAAPGVNVYTTFPNHSNKLGKTHYDYGKGTSMSAPFVGGAAGLIWSTVGDANGDGRANDDVRARLEAYADDIPGTGTYWAAGRLNACNAAAASPTACPLP